MTDSSNNVVWWAEGSWNGVITDRAVMLLPPSVPQDLTERLWWLLRSDEGSLTHALDELVMGMGGRLGAIPDFVLAVTTPDVLHMALRGEAEVEVDGRPVDAAGITTWFETTFTSPTSVVAKTPEKAGPILRPASDAVVCASRLIIKGGRDQTDDGEDEDPDRAGSTEPEHHGGAATGAGNDEWIESAEDSPAAAVAAQPAESGAEAAAALALTGELPRTGPESSADGIQAVDITAEAPDAEATGPDEGPGTGTAETSGTTEAAESRHGAEQAEDGASAASPEAAAVEDEETRDHSTPGLKDPAEAAVIADEAAAVGSAPEAGASAEATGDSGDAVPDGPGAGPQAAEAFAAAFAEPEGTAMPAAAAGVEEPAQGAASPLPVELPDFLVEAEQREERADWAAQAGGAERAASREEGAGPEPWQAPGEPTAEELAFAASSPQEGDPSALAPLDAEPSEPQADPLASGLVPPPPPPAQEGAGEAGGLEAEASAASMDEAAAERPGDHDGRTIASLPEDLSKELRAELLNQGVTPDEPLDSPRGGRRDHAAAPIDVPEGADGTGRAPASAVLLQEAPRFGDHDGHTVAGLPEDLVGQLVSLIGGPEKEAEEALPVVTPAEPDAVRIVLSAVCGQGHPNPTNYTTCRECGAELNRPAKSVACPPLGRMVTSSGEAISLDRPVLVGRGPVSSDVASVADVPVRTLQIPSPNQLVSRNHILIELDAWSVLAQDLGNCNGTILNRAGEPSVRLAASNPVLLRSGDVLDLGDGQTLTFENLP
ncbi:FHA domain-containing protein [Actinomyces bowdenii]|uniref:FHA domain-containing protein n=1 Tax=Actinomyces bowdenii TaxID=131109 RepID=UPI001ABC338E|nr:FHA domain-containing protein [Actinomyces bowdenii]MBO3725431.1 FHA domain-containing protein [Actinomyces bowdenii]